MSGASSTLLARSADLHTFPARVWDESGTGVGPFSSVQTVLEPGTNIPLTPAKDSSVQELGAQLGSILQKLGDADQAVTVIVEPTSYQPSTVTQKLSANGPGALVPITLADLVRMPRNLLPSILCGLSSGAVLTYSIEVTGDDIGVTGYNPASGNWFGFDGMVGLTAAQNGTLEGRVTAIRPRITAYTSGTLTVSVIL